MPTPFVEESLAVLTRTPATLDALLRDLPAPWTSATEGEGTWSAYDVIGHLAHTERAAWLPRLLRIVEDGTSKPFDAVDREAQFRESEGKPLAALLDEFAAARRRSVERIRALDLRPEQLELQGRHPVFGPVTLRQYLAAWTAHDLDHIVQIGRVLAKRYRPEVGPFSAYLSVLK
jgi:hypothetical protein